MSISRNTRRRPPRFRPSLSVQALEARCLLAGGWSSYGGNAQHTALTSVPAQPLQTIRWQATIDQASKTAASQGSEIFTHYGSPLVTGANTVIVPITNVNGTYSVSAFNGGTGATLWTVTSDYVLPPHDWTPAFSPVLATVPGTTPFTRLYFPGADGTVEYVNNPDSPTASITGRFTFYAPGSLSNVKISTPLTADASGNLYFGYSVTDTPNTAILGGGIARLTPLGAGSSTSVASLNLTINGEPINQVGMNSAPAISNDGKDLYIGVCSPGGHGDLLELETAGLSYVASVSLREPAGTANAGLPSLVYTDSSAVPTVGPDGDVFYGVLENNLTSNNDRGWLLHFSGDLATTKDAGFFGWDDTASIVPASMVPSYHGTSSYLLMTKYNNYANIGTGDGRNKIAILDPDTRDPDCPVGMNMMNVVLSILGPTPDPGQVSAQAPNPVREWCINSAVVDTASDSVYANCEDGTLYQWNLSSPGSFVARVKLTSGIGEAYTPTVIGPDGTVYAINDATLFAVGGNASASFVKTDTTTQGAWKLAYGGDGFNLVADPSSNNPSIPSYATVAVTGASAYTWASSTSDPRALQSAAANSTNRLAACWYTANSFNVDIHLTDGKTHQVAAYALDWDVSQTRSETVQVIDDVSGAVLDTRSISGFYAGTYLVWNLSGNVTLRFTNTNPQNNVVLSGLFFGGNATVDNASASFVKTDTTTQGAWKLAYGGDGFNLVSDPSANNPSIPSYATVAVTGASAYTWASSTSDPRALQSAAANSTNRLAACWYTANSFGADIHLTDGKTHQVAAYALDWDATNARSETVQVVDDATGAVLDTRSISGFYGGTYLVWNLSGNVTLRFLNTNPQSNVVLSGLFFGGNATVDNASASFVKTDTTTQGSWKSVYGGDGYDIAQDPSASNPTIPAYATLAVNGAGTYTWASSTADPRALQVAAPGSTNRIAGTWYTNNSFSVDIHLTDGKTHQVAAYALDWDATNARSETVQVVDDATGAVLDTRSISGFYGGTYLVWNLSGNVTLRFLNTNPQSNVVLSGLFFG